MAADGAMAAVPATAWDRTQVLPSVSRDACEVMVKPMLAELGLVFQAVISIVLLSDLVFWTACRAEMVSRWWWKGVARGYRRRWLESPGGYLDCVHDGSCADSAPGRPSPSWDID